MHLPGLSPEELNALEHIVGPLPAELRSFYRVSNGGVPEKRYFEDDEGFERGIESILSALHRTYEHEVLLEEYYEEMVNRRGSLSSEYVPFARNAGDDLYVMHRETGGVFFFAHDVPNAPLQHVADSLQEILDRAQTEDDFYG